MADVSLFPFKDIRERALGGDKVERGFFLFCMTIVLAFLITAAATNIAESSNQDVVISMWEVRETYGSNVYISSVERLGKSGCKSGASRFQLMEAVICVALALCSIDIFLLLMEYVEKPVMKRAALIGFAATTVCIALAWAICLFFNFVPICTEGGSARGTLGYSPISKKFDFGAGFITLSMAVAVTVFCILIFFIRRIVDRLQEKREVTFIEKRRKRRQDEIDALGVDLIDDDGNIVDENGKILQKAARKQSGFGHREDELEALDLDGVRMELDEAHYLAGMADRQNNNMNNNRRQSGKRSIDSTSAAAATRRRRSGAAGDDDDDADDEDPFEKMRRTRLELDRDDDDPTSRNTRGGGGTHTNNRTDSVAYSDGEQQQQTHDSNRNGGGVGIRRRGTNNRPRNLSGVDLAFGAQVASVDMTTPPKRGGGGGANPTQSGGIRRKSSGKDNKMSDQRLANRNAIANAGNPTPYDESDDDEGLLPVHRRTSDLSIESAQRNLSESQSLQSPAVANLDIDALRTPAGGGGGRGGGAKKGASAGSNGIFSPPPRSPTHLDAVSTQLDISMSTNSPMLRGGGARRGSGVIVNGKRTSIVFPPSDSNFARPPKPADYDGGGRGDSQSPTAFLRLGQPSMSYRRGSTAGSPAYGFAGGGGLEGGNASFSRFQDPMGASGAYQPQHGEYYYEFNNANNTYGNGNSAANNNRRRQSEDFGPMPARPTTRQPEDRMAAYDEGLSEGGGGGATFRDAFAASANAPPPPRNPRENTRGFRNSNSHRDSNSVGASSENGGGSVPDGPIRGLDVGAIGGSPHGDYGKYHNGSSGDYSISGDVGMGERRGSRAGRSRSITFLSAQDDPALAAIHGGVPNSQMFASPTAAQLMMGKRGSAPAVAGGSPPLSGRQQQLRSNFSTGSGGVGSPNAALPTGRGGVITDAFGASPSPSQPVSPAFAHNNQHQQPRSMLASRQKYSYKEEDGLGETSPTTTPTLGGGGGGGAVCRTYTAAPNPNGKRRGSEGPVFAPRPSSSGGPLVRRGNSGGGGHTDDEDEDARPMDIRDDDTNAGPAPSSRTRPPSAAGASTNTNSGGSKGGGGGLLSNKSSGDEDEGDHQQRRRSSSSKNGGAQRRSTYAEDAGGMDEVLGDQPSPARPSSAMMAAAASNDGGKKKTSRLAGAMGGGIGSSSSTAAASSSPLGGSKKPHRNSSGADSDGGSGGGMAAEDLVNSFAVSQRRSPVAAGGSGGGGGGPSPTLGPSANSFRRGSEWAPPKPPSMSINDKNAYAAFGLAAGGASAVYDDASRHAMMMGESGANFEFDNEDFM